MSSGSCGSSKSCTASIARGQQERSADETEGEQGVVVWGERVGGRLGRAGEGAGEASGLRSLLAMEYGTEGVSVRVYQRHARQRRTE